MNLLHLILFHQCLAVAIYKKLNLLDIKALGVIESEGLTADCVNRFGIEHRMFTITLGVNENYSRQGYYDRIIHLVRNSTMHVIGGGEGWDKVLLNLKCL